MKRIAIAGAGMAMAAAAAGLLGGQPAALSALVPRAPYLEVREHDDKTRRQRNRLNKKLKAKLGRQREARRSDNHAHPLPTRTEGQLLVERMTNWQRNQWARAGYPGMRDGEVKEIRPFAELERRESRT